MNPANFPRRALAGVFFLWLLFVSCNDGTGPGELVGSLAIVPVFESSAAALVPVAKLRVVLLREDSVTVAKDTVFDLVAGQDSVDLAINVTLLSTSEQFFLEMQLINAAQDTVFRGGPTIVTASTSASDPTVAEILLVYTGTGFDATAVRITTTTASAFFGETVNLAAEALDAAGAVIPGTPIKWSSVVPAAGDFPDDESGAFLTGSVRGPALVAATLLTGPTDTAAVMVQPPPSAIAITSGDGQTGGIGAVLPLPLVVAVTAADGLGVEGVEVVFGTPGGNGSLSAASVFTDAQGMAQVDWTLGSVPGAMQATATVPAAGGASVNFGATAQAVAFRWLNTGGGNWSNPTNWDLGLVPGAGSTVIIDVDGTYTVNLDVNAAIDVLTLGAATGTQTLAIATNSLTLSGVVSTVSTNGVVDLSGSMLAGASGMSMGGTFNWTGGAIDGTGRLIIEPVATLTLGGGAKTLSGGRVLENFGTATWVAGDIDAAGASAIFNSVSGTFDVQGDVQFTQGVGGGSFSNNGTFTRTVGTGAVTFSNRFDNLATADVQTGTLQLNAGGTGGASGTFMVASGATLEFGGGTHTTSAITLAATGTLNVAAGTVALTGVYSQGISAVLTGAGTFDVPGNVITGGAINMAAGTLKVGGVLNPTGAFTVGTVVFQGVGVMPQLVPSALTPYTNVEVTGDTVEVDGSLSINGTLVVPGTGNFTIPSALTATVNVAGDVTVTDNGVLNVGGTGSILNANSNMLLSVNGELYIGLSGGVFITGNLTTQDQAYFEMLNSFDELSVGGDAIIMGGSTATSLPDGRFLIGGNFTQGGDPQSFAPGALFDVIFTNVCTPKTITFADPVNSYFPSVDLNGSSIQLASDVEIRGGLIGGGDITQTGLRQLTVTGNSFLTAGCNSTINLEKLRVEGDFAISSAVTLTTLEVGDILSLVTGSYSATNTVFLGIDGPQEIPSSLSYQNVEVTGDVEFEYFTTQTISGNLVVSGSGILNFNDTDVTLGGDFTTQDNGVIILASFYDALTVTGNIVFGGGNTGPGSPLCPVLGCLADGTIYASGNFTQLGTNSSESFHAGDFNTVYFDGTVAQTLSFTDTGSGSGTSHFANIAFSNSVGVTLGSDIYAHCDLLSFAGPAAVVIGNGNTLTVGGLGVTDLQLQRVLLVYDGVPDPHSSGIFSSFDNVTFTNYAATDTRFTIIHPGAASPFTFNNLTFTTTPTTGFYMDVTDSLADANVLTIQMASPTPGSPATFVLTNGGAVVTWPWP